MTVIIFIYKKLKTTNQIPCKLTKKTTKSIKNSKIWYFCVLMLRYKLVVLTETEPPLSYQSKHEVRIQEIINSNNFTHICYKSISFYIKLVIKRILLRS